MRPRCLAAVPVLLALFRAGEIQPEPKLPLPSVADQMDPFPEIVLRAPFANAGAIESPLAAAVRANRECGAVAGPRINVDGLGAEWLWSRVRGLGIRPRRPVKEGKLAVDVVSPSFL